MFYKPQRIAWHTLLFYSHDYRTKLKKLNYCIGNKLDGEKMPRNFTINALTAYFFLRIVGL